MNTSIKLRLACTVVASGLFSSCAHPLPPQDSGIKPASFWSRLTGQPQPQPEKTPPDLNSILISDDKAEVEHDWWKHFNDPTLERLITQAVANNKTLGIARARVQEARSMLDYGHANQKPQFDAIVKAKRANEGLATDDKSRSTFDANIQAAWEIDIFGRNLPRLAQIESVLQSTEATEQAVLVGLLAELGRDYFDLRNYRQQIDITVKNLTNQKKTLDLIRAQLQGAMASDFDVQRAAAQASMTESKLPGLQTAYDRTLNRINVLLGAVPGAKDDLIQAVQALQPLDQRVIVAAPATVLANRPDVKAAERNFAASMSATEAATKRIFPQISLLTFFGIQDTSTLSSFPWSAGLTIVQPLLDFGRIRTQVAMADAVQQQAFLSYQQSVLEALEDMENALTAYKNEVVRNGLLRNSVEQNRKAADFAQQQFQSGFTGLLDVLVAQGNVLEAESALAESDMALRKNLVSIYTASGGGWRVDPAAASTAQDADPA